jgi:diguanylate cyclase (GGDEF)-like protein
VAGFARAWDEALRGTCYVALTPVECEQFLGGLAERLAVAVSAEPFDPTVGYWVGVDLVTAGFAAPETLGRTITILNTRLAGHLGRSETTVNRVTALVESLAAGFAATVHDRTLDAQDSIRLATLTALHRAEGALRDSEARFHHAASHDPLTDLPNRMLFTERLAHLLATAGPGGRLGICCIDLDRFTAITDSLGHEVGDQLVVAAAGRLRELGAAGGHLVARLSRDEFAILIEATGGAEDAVKVADRALAVLAEPFHLDGLELPVTASAGVVEEPADRADAAELVRAADVALHWAKADGRARWRLFERRRSTADAARYRLSATMPAALRRGEFTLVYQPIVEVAGGRLVGVEALARWRHPDRGPLGADRFIGLAQDTGLIVALGARLLDQACRQAAGWQGRPEPPYVSVNLAARQLHHPGLVGDVAQIIDGAGLDPRLLQLEITEQAIIGTDRETITILRRLAGLGVRIAIDDFGTGYANLACLRALPLDGLKLDASMLREPPDRVDLAGPEFLASVVALGHTLGLAVTAEGIETPAQAELLRATGCDTGQGWHFGRPAKAAEITSRLAGAADPE